MDNARTISSELYRLILHRLRHVKPYPSWHIKPRGPSNRPSFATEGITSGGNQPVKVHPAFGFRQSTLLSQLRQHRHCWLPLPFLLWIATCTV